MIVIIDWVCERMKDMKDEKGNEICSGCRKELFDHKMCTVSVKHWSGSYPRRDYDLCFHCVRDVMKVFDKEYFNEMVDMDEKWVIR